MPSAFEELLQFKGTTPQEPADMRGNRYLEGLNTINSKRVEDTFAFRVYK
ncbi:hypothetical protein [Erwinia sp.]|nr:hypothetical protein [Erwinia sp.]